MNISYMNKEGDTWLACLKIEASKRAFLQNILGEGKVSSTRSLILAYLRSRI